MKAYSAMRVDRAIAKAISERIVKTETFEQAEADLETLRALHARTPSEALPLALAHLSDFFDEDDPKRKRMTEEGQVALEQARAAEQRRTGSETTQPFVVSPTAYEEVPPRVAALALDADVVWHLPPAFSGNWTDLQSDAAENAVDRLRAAFPKAWGEGVAEGVRAVRRMEMSCYPGFDAVEVLFQFKDGDRQKKSQLALLGPEIAFWITGASPGLHKLNSMRREDGKPHLDISTEESAAEYLRFFCSAVHSDEGPFRVVPTFEELAAHMKTGEAFEVSDGVFSGAVVRRIEGEADETAWEIEVPLLYADVLFRSQFRLQRSGMVEMFEDDPIATELPAIRQAIGRGLRVVRGSAT